MNAVNSLELIGRGIYTRKEASRLTHAPEWAVRHWIRGDKRTLLSIGRKPTPPLIQREYPELTRPYTLSFLDLIEIRVIYLLKREGVSLQSIRRAHIELRRLFRQEHPFALNRLWTDGRDLWTKIAREEEDAPLLHILSRQYELNPVLEPFLTSVDFDSDGIAVRWWPMSKERQIVIDPKRRLGEPITQQEGVPTFVINATYESEQSIDKVRSWYDLSPESIVDAIDYERSLTKLAAESVN